MLVLDAIDRFPEVIADIPKRQGRHDHDGGASTDCCPAASGQATPTATKSWHQRLQQSRADSLRAGDHRESQVRVGSNRTRVLACRDSGEHHRELSVDVRGCLLE